MANVKTTQEIWNRIENKINSLFQARVDYAHSWYNYGLTEQEINKRCMDVLFTAEERAFIKSHGKKWFNEYNRMTVNIIVGDEKHPYTIEFAPPELMPTKMDSYYERDSWPVVDPVLAEIAKKRKEGTARVVNERNAFREQAQQLYNAAPSINTLIKTWPAVLDLLPGDVVERVNRKVERSTPRKLAEETGIDMNQLNAKLLMAKVAQ